jgi:membrane fusion protein (multidrug efflux system)
VRFAFRSRCRSIAACLIGAALLAACGNNEPSGAAKGAEAGKSAGAPQSSGAPKSAGGPPGAGAPVSVTVLKMEPKQVPILIDTVGRTEGSREVEIRARVSGILQKQSYAEGNPVRAQAKLYQIDSAPFEIALAQVQAALAQERARNEQATREAARLQGLIAQRAISQREADDAATQLKLSNAALLSAETRVREAELNLSYTTVTAPISGVTGRTLRSEGSLVSAGTESSLLTTLTQTDPIWARFALSESEYALLRGAAGRRAEVRLSLPEGSAPARQQGKGRINFAASTVDARLGTVQLRAEFANPNLALLPGQFVRVQVVAGSKEAFLVPQTAVMQGEQGRFVWTVGAEGKAAPRPVQTANWIGADWVITGGLKPADTVIVDNLLRLRPGTPVQASAGAGAPAATPSGAGAPAATPSGAGAPAATPSGAVAPGATPPGATVPTPAAKKAG